MTYNSGIARKILSGKCTDRILQIVILQLRWRFDKINDKSLLQKHVYIKIEIASVIRNTSLCLLRSENKLNLKPTFKNWRWKISKWSENVGFTRFKFFFHYDMLNRKILKLGPLYDGRIGIVNRGLATEFLTSSLVVDNVRNLPRFIYIYFSYFFCFIYSTYTYKTY